MENCICYIDCRNDNNSDQDFFTLNLWGKPVFAYTLDSAMQTGIFSAIYILTDSAYIKYLIGQGYNKQIKITEKINFFDCNKICLLSGRAPFLKSLTIKEAVKSVRGGICILHI